MLVHVCCRPRAARKADILRPQIGIGKIAWQLALCAPEIDLEGERVSPRPAVEHPLLEADRVGTVDFPRHRRWKPRCEEIWGAEQQDAERTGLIEQRMG